MTRWQRLLVQSVPVLLVLMVFAVPTPAAAGDWIGHANFFLGQKQLKNSDWDPVDNQTEFGAEVAWGKKAWPILIATDVFGSANEKTELGTKLTGSSSEIDLGIRKIWVSKKIHPYIGGGVGQISAKAEIDDPFFGSASVDDSAIGFWFGGGVFWRLGHRFNIGFSGRWSQAKVTFTGTDVEAGGLHAGLLLGWGWPASK